MAGEERLSAKSACADKARNKGSTITAGNAVFVDHYTGEATGVDKDMKPVPSPPQKPLGQTLVGNFEHRWYAGTKATGKGVHVSTHTAWTTPTPGCRTRRRKRALYSRPRRRPFRR